MLLSVLIIGVNKCKLHLILEHLDPGLNLPLSVSSELSVQEGFLLRGSRLVIPSFGHVIKDSCRTPGHHEVPGKGQPSSLVSGTQQGYLTNGIYLSRLYQKPRTASRTINSLKVSPTIFGKKLVLICFTGRTPITFWY